MKTTDRSYESKLAMRKMREERKLKGLCITCGAEKVGPGELNCRSCRDKRNEHERSLRQFRKEKGLCSKCGKKLDRVGAYCGDCVVGVTKGTQRFRKKNVN